MLLVSALMMAAWADARAEEGGASFWLPGQYASLAAVPPSPSWSLSTDAWRFGAGVQNQYSKTFGWGFSAEYACGCTLDVDKQSAAPVALGGRGNLVGSYPDTGMFFLAFNFNWVF